MITIFDDDFDKADHIGEIRRRPLARGPDTLNKTDVVPLSMAGITWNGEDVTPFPAELIEEEPIPSSLERTATGRIVNRRMELFGKALDQLQALGGNPEREAARRVLARLGRSEG